MNENANSPTKWLRYLLYAGIAATVNSLLGNLSLLGVLTRWVGLAINAATIYLLFRLTGTNARYRNAAIFSTAALVCAQIGGTILVLVCSVCGTVAQYQEYYGHSELIEARDSRLAGKWHSLFWAQFTVSLLLGALISLIAVVMVMISGSEAAATGTLVTVFTSILSLILKALYLVYLHRTIKALATEFVVEGVKE